MHYIIQDALAVDSKGEEKWNLCFREGAYK